MAIISPGYSQNVQMLLVYAEVTPQGVVALKTADHKQLIKSKRLSKSNFLRRCLFDFVSGLKSDTFAKLCNSDVYLAKTFNRKIKKNRELLIRMGHSIDQGC